MRFQYFVHTSLNLHTIKKRGENVFLIKMSTSNYNKKDAAVAAATHMWWSYMIIICDHHVWSSYMIIIYDQHVWSSYLIIIHDHPISWSYMIILYNHPIWWSCMMIKYDDHICWSYMMTIYDDHTYMIIMRTIYDSYIKRWWFQGHVRDTLGKFQGRFGITLGSF